MKINHLSLHITKPDASLAFYQQVLGMTRVFSHRRLGESGEEISYFLAFVNPGESTDTLKSSGRTCLELIHRVDEPFTPDNEHPDNAFWKIGITVTDLDTAQQQLIQRGVAVSPAEQFLDIGYLCHLRDPDGYVIELLQRSDSMLDADADRSAYPLGSDPVLAHISLRVSDIDAAIESYRQQGMTLLSRQRVEPHRFTLYFLALDGQAPDGHDLDSASHRPWLWNRPFTLIELQHRWDRASDDPYRGGRETGFAGVSLEQTF